MDIQINRAHLQTEKPSPLYSVPPSTHEPVATDRTQNNTLAWRAIFAGLFIAFLTDIMLLSLGMAIGGASLRSAIQGATGVSGLGTGSALWVMFSTFISLYIGSFAASKVSGMIPLRTGQVQGVVISALFFGLLFSQLGSTIGFLSKGMSGAFSTMTQSLNDLSKNPVIQNTIQKSLGTLPLKSAPDQVFTELATRLVQGHTTDARDYLADQTGITSAEADLRIQQLATSTQDILKTVGNTTAQIVTLAGWTIFISVFFGTVCAFLGGAMGCATHLSQRAAKPGKTHEEEPKMTQAS
jgi:hypothetical protein